MKQEIKTIAELEKEFPGDFMHKDCKPVKVPREAKNMHELEKEFPEDFRNPE